MNMSFKRFVSAFQTAERIASTPMIAGDKIVFGSCDKNIYCITKETGKLVWRHRYT